MFAGSRGRVAGFRVGMRPRRSRKSELGGGEEVRLRGSCRYGGTAFACVDAPCWPAWPKPRAQRAFAKAGEPGRNRTFNQQIKSLLLCQLSYGPTLEAGSSLPLRDRKANEDPT